MATSKQCDFCTRENGLKVFISRRCIGIHHLESRLEGNFDNDHNFLDGIFKSYLSKCNDLNELKKNLIEIVTDSINNQKEYALKQVENNTGSPNTTSPAMTVYSHHRSAQYQKMGGVKAKDKSFYYGATELRQGYLYVFQEHINRWEEYSITEEGFLKRIDQNNFFGQTAPPPDDLKPCEVNLERASSLTVNIPKPDKASKVWFYYSDIAWSKATKHRNKKLYSEFMQPLDVKKFLNAGNADNTVLMPNSYILSHLADYGHLELYVSRSREGGGHYVSNLIPGYNNNDIDMLKEYLNSGSDKELKIKMGAMFTIDDPVGVVMDLGNFISGIQTFTDHYTDEEKTLNDIETLGVAVTRTNHDEFLTNEERMEWAQINAMAGPEAAMGQAIANIFKSEEKHLEEERQLKQSLNRNAQLDWQKNYLEKCLDPSKFNEAVKTRALKLKVKGELRKALDEWLVEIWNSKIFKNHWIYNYERNHPLQGLMYLWNVVNILLVTPNLPKVLDHFAESTTKNTASKDNCVFQAFCLNSDAIQTAMASSLSQSTIATMPWGDLIGRFNAYVQTLIIPNLKASLYSAYNLLILKFHPVLEYMIQRRPDVVKKSTNGVAIIHPVTIGMAGIQGKVLGELEVNYRNKGQFNQVIMRLLESHHVKVYGSVKGFNHNQILHLVSKDPFWQSFYVKSEKRGKMSLSLPVVNELNKLPSSMNPDQFFKELTQQSKNGSVLPLTNDAKQQANIHLNPVNEQRLFIDPQAALNKITLTGNLFLQSWALLTMWNDPNLKSTKENFYEKHGKLAAGMTGVVMASLEFVSYQLNVYVHSGSLTNSKILNINKFLLRLTSVNSWLWRGLGSAIGAIFGAYDFYNGRQAYKQGETKHGILLMTSGVIIIGSATAFFILGASNPLGWIVLLIGLGVGMISHLIRDNEVQKWLYKSSLGKFKDYSSFQNYDEQMKEYNTKFVGLEVIE